MAINIMDNPEGQTRQAGMAAYERQMKSRLDQAKRNNDQRLAAGQQRSNEIQQRNKKDYSSVVNRNQEATVGRALNRQKLEDSREVGAPLGQVPSKSASSGATAEEAPRFGLGGLRGALAKQQNKDREANAAGLKAKADLASGLIGQDVAKEAAKKASQAIWMAVHEFLEDAALSFVDIMIITGPLCIFVFLIRILAMLTIGGMLTIKFKGFEVPLVPMFTAAEVVPRFSKMLLIFLVTGLVWFILILVIWAITDPWGFGWTTVRSIFGGGGGGAGGGATGTF